MAGSGVTRDELLFGLRVVEREIAEGSPSSADFEVRELRQSVERHGLDPGPHPSLKAIEERLEPALTQAIEHNRRLIECGDARHVCPLYAIGYVLDDIRSGEIPPAPTEAEVEELRAELAALRGTNRGLESTIASMKAEIADRDRAIDLAKHEIADLQGRNNRQYTDIQLQVGEVTRLRAGFARLKDEARTTETANRAYSAAVKAYAATVSGLRADLAVRQAEVTALLDANGRQAKRIADLESKATDSYVEKGQAKAWVAVFRAIKEVEPDAFQRADTGLECAVRAVRELAAARDERDALRDECEALKEKSFEAAAEIERLKGPREVVVFDTTPVIIGCMDLQRKLDELNRDLEAAIAATAR